jgi:uncharacterized membrane protein YedE/YeeE
MLAISSLLCGLVFGFGLLISGMTQPAKVLGFLDVLGRWDPTLAFVMTGALVVSSAGYAIARRQSRPILSARHLWPAQCDIDRSLVVGSILFGIGWGLVGLCPGPALENLANLSPRVIAFVLAMLAGMIAQEFWRSRLSATAAVKDTTLASADG